MRRIFFTCILVAAASMPLQAQSISRELYKHYYGHRVRLRVDVLKGSRAAVLSSGGLNVAPIDAMSRNLGAFCAAGKKYVIGAIRVRPTEVEFAIYSFITLPTPVFNPGREVVRDDPTVRSHGRTLAAPIASIVLKYESPGDLAFDKVDRVLRTLLEADAEPSRPLRVRAP